jgi:polyisoprenoid-binding protein YceI
MKIAIPLIIAALFIAGPLQFPARAFAQVKTVESADTSSTLTYRLTHPLHEIEATSRDVRYRVDIDTAKREIRAVSATVEVMTFNSGNSNRDSHAMEVVDALTYPEAGFTGGAITHNGDSISVAGKVTFHGVTKDATMRGMISWSPEKVNVRGGFSLSLTEFGIERPSLLMIPVSDSLRFELDATLKLK